MTRLVYIAGPIDFVPSTVQANERRLRDQVKDGLVDVGLDVYDPASAFTVSGAGGGPYGGLQQINDEALLRAGVLVVVWPVRSVSVGTPMEIQRALDLSTPVAIVNDGWLSRSWALAGRKEIEWFAVGDNSLYRWVREQVEGK